MTKSIKAVFFAAVLAIYGVCYATASGGAITYQNNTGEKLDLVPSHGSAFELKIDESKSVPVSSEKGVVQISSLSSNKVIACQSPGVSEGLAGAVISIRLNKVTDSLLCVVHPVTNSD
jgi:hypothetical protein